MTQEQVAEKLDCDVRTIRNIEKSGSKLDIWKFMAMLEILGHPSDDFWLLYLSSDEYEQYREYRKLKFFMRENKLDEAKSILNELQKDKKITEKSLIKNYLDMCAILLNPNIEELQKIESLIEVLRRTIPDFCLDRVSKYTLTYNEIEIINKIAINFNNIKKYDDAVRLWYALIDNATLANVSEEDKDYMLPALWFNLSNTLGPLGKYKEALNASQKGLEIATMCSNFRYVPHLLYNMACSYHCMKEEDSLVKIYLIRAYHCACGICDFENAEIIKKDAKTSFGIDI